LSVRLLLSCGEASGDLYAGALTRELRALDPSLTIAGLGGPQFEAAGGRLIDDYRDIAVTGLTEAIAKVPRSFAALRRLVAAARAERPDALVVIDSPDFNFRLAPKIKKLDVPVVYYISPQIWAWRPRRLNTIRRFADRVLVIFPFEEAIYREGGVPVEFVGHPLVDLSEPSTTRGRFLTSHGLSASAPTVAVLPGSRPNEVSRILPDLVASAGPIRARIPDAQFVVARAPDPRRRVGGASAAPPGRGTGPSAPAHAHRHYRVCGKPPDHALAASSGRSLERRSGEHGTLDRRPSGHALGAVGNPAGRGRGGWGARRRRRAASCGASRTDRA